MAEVGTIYLGLLVLSTIVSLMLAWLAWSRRMHAGALPLCLLSLAIAVLAISSGLEPLTPTLAAKEFWVNVQYIGYGFIPLLYLVMVLMYLGIRQWLTPRRLLLLAVIPLLTLLLSWTNGLHHLMRSQLHPESVGHLVFLGKTVGIWGWVHISYSFVIMTVSIVKLIIPCFHAQRFYREQTLVLLLGLLIPFIVSVLYVARFSIGPSMDLTPAVASLGCMLIFFSMLRYRLFDLVPVARDQVVDNISDGMLVMDLQQRVVDLNPACERMLALRGVHLIGSSIFQVLAGRPHLLELLVHPPATELVEFTLDEREGKRYWELRLSTLMHKRGYPLGYLALFHEITERKRAEQAIRHLAYHDRLTDLPNREALQQRMIGKLARGDRGGAAARPE